MWFVVEVRWEKARGWFHCRAPEGEEATARVYLLVKRHATRLFLSDGLPY